MRIAFLFVPFLSFALAQNTAGLHGHITDPSGLVVAGANITLQDSSRHTYPATSGPAGAYVFSNLAPGNYNTTTTAPQLSLSAPRSTTIHAGNNTLDLQLSLAT